MVLLQARADCPLMASSNFPTAESGVPEQFKASIDILPALKRPGFLLRQAHSRDHLFGGFPREKGKH